VSEVAVREPLKPLQLLSGCPDNPQPNRSEWGLHMAAVLVYGDPQSPRGSLLHSTGLVALPLLSVAGVQQSLTEAFFPETP
jgi:hypothetical protein